MAALCQILWQDVRGIALDPEGVKAVKTVLGLDPVANGPMMSGICEAMLGHMEQLLQPNESWQFHI